MSYQRERDEFIARMSKEGLPIDVTRLLLREATGLNRRAELACSSEAADRDRVKCPGDPLRHKTTDPRKLGSCLCDLQAGGVHTDIPRITLQDWQSEQRIIKALAAVNKPIRVATATADVLGPPQWAMETQGDPRGYVLRVIPPSYAERNKDRNRDNLDSIGVPSGPSGIRW